MSNKPKSLMTLYEEGSLISRELQEMMTDYAAQHRFDRELHEDYEFFGDVKRSRETANFNSSGEKQCTLLPEKH